MTDTTTTTVLSLADLEAFDPHAPAGGRERRFCCTLCGAGKPRDAAHRCFGVNCDTGAFHCHRCDARGKLTDFWQKQPDQRPADRAQRARVALNRAFTPTVADHIAVTEPKPRTPRETSSKVIDWRAIYNGAGEIGETKGAKYLQGRGVALEVAALSGVRFTKDYPPIGPAVLFPIRDFAGELRAVSARAIESNTKGNTRAGGPKSDGAFGASWRVFESITTGSDVSTCSGRAWTAFDRTLPAIIVCEAPIDALSLATCGFPALALIGCSAPKTLHRVTALRRVLLAFDADEAGDKAQAKIEALMRPYGAKCERLRPDGAKDWNEMLQVLGRAHLSDWLAERVLMAPNG